MIDIKDLDVIFPDGTAGLSNINLHVSEGELVALVGPSGSGKTTLLRTIAGFVEPSSGSLSLGGQDVTRIPPEKRNIGMVFQQHAVWPHMSVAANVEYPLTRRKIAKTTRKRLVSEVLNSVGLQGFEQRRPESLSGGQRQRVALARAIVTDPRVVLLDEALSALDEPLRDSLRRQLVTLNKTKNLTTIHVTHDRSEALAIADKVVVLVNGHVQHIGTPSELLNRPASPAVAQFMGDATLIDATLNADGTVECSDLGIELTRENYVPMDENLQPGDAVIVAVLPAHVSEVPPGSPYALDAVVTSVLYEGNAFSITARASGAAGDNEFRATVTDRIDVGTPISLDISGALVYLRPAS